MSLGSNTETVEVTSQAGALQVENATLGTVVDGTTIREVPLTNRNYTQVLTMSAGVAGDINNAASLGKGTQDVYVNGASSISNNFHMDGADINNYGSGRAGDFVQQAGIAIPNPDSLQEFKIQTTNYDAGFGRDAGANVDVVTKTGGNAIHGSAWEFFRNDVLNANDTFLKIGGQKRAVMKQNQFGGTLGGPIIKDKLFIFGTYQGTRQVNGLSSSSFASLTLFPVTDDRSAAGIAKVACPGSSTGKNWAPFNGGVNVACNGSNINPVALNLLNKKIAKRHVPDSNAAALSYRYERQSRWAFVVQHSGALQRRPVHGEHGLGYHGEAHFVGALLLLERSAEPAVQYLLLHSGQRVDADVQQPGGRAEADFSAERTLSQ